MKTIDKKIDLLGIYMVKSPYHEKTYYLPFIIQAYNHSDNTYNVKTIEYKGLIGYKVDTFYSEKSIIELIANETIIHKSSSKVSDYKDVGELVSQYLNAENQQI